MEPLNTSMRWPFAVTIRREVIRVHTGWDRHAAHAGSERFEAPSVVLGHRNREVRPASTRRPHAPEACAIRSRISARRHGRDSTRAQPLPDHVFDVVLEQHDGHRPRHRHVHGSKQEIGDAQIDVAAFDRAAHFVSQRRSTPFPQVNGVGRQPRPRHRGGECGIATLGRLPGASTRRADSARADGRGRPDRRRLHAS